ncbi:MAG: hypothetical protein WC979_01795 [Candidatus Pacearchaeota archaeon]|jgi:hypothetical protein|nr:hypothetical protein [Clostridia bacterium]
MEVIDISNLGPWDGLKQIMVFINEQASYNKIITNAQLGTFLMDAFEAQQLPVIKPSLGLIKNPETYKIIKLKHADVFVDPNMRWDDTKLIFKSNDKEKIVEIKHSNNLI